MQRLKFAALFLVTAALARTARAQTSYPPPTPAPPVIPAGIYNVTNYGALGDGVSTNTTAIQNAINAAAASAAKGGTVEIPPGVFVCGPLTLKSSINLQIDAGANLRLLPYDKYPGGIVSPANFLSASSLHDIEISGSGTIDGQGAPWWPGYHTNNRPTLIAFSSCNRVLIQNITVSNSPAQNIAVKSKSGNVLVQGITEIAPASSDPTNASHNTDGIDLAATNCIIQNCNISVGDDNVAVGSSGGLSAGILITNCTFGNGHGVSIGSFTSSGVSNMTVINCTFNGTDNGIRMKSDNDRGGVVQNLFYLNLGMTNVGLPLIIYSYYNEVGTPTSITPLTAANEPVPAVTNTTPLWSSILISNVTATAANGSLAGIIWGRSELPATNITFQNVNITASTSFDVYNASAIRFIDSQINLPSGPKTFELYNAQLMLTNSAPTGSVSIDGLTTNSIGNSIALYNETAVLNTTNVFGSGPLWLGGCIAIINGSFNFVPGTVLNYLLGTNNTEVDVSGNLALGGTVNVAGGAGFGPGAYTLLNYSGVLSGAFPILGSAPSGYAYKFDTNTPGQVKLDIGPSLAPVTLSSLASANRLILSWPADHTGWRLQIQMNPQSGLGTNWTTVANSQATNAIVIPISPTNRSVFLRLTYP